MNFKSNFSILNLFLVFLASSNATLIEVELRTYCSSEFIFEGQLSKLCGWFDATLKEFKYMYDYALEDCPDGFYLDSLNRLDVTLTQSYLNLPCKGELLIWKRQFNDFNIITLNTLSRNYVFSYSNGPKSAHFICSKKKEIGEKCIDTYECNVNAQCMNVTPFIKKCFSLSPCPSDWKWNSYLYFCYYLNDKESNWDDSLNDCRSRKGILMNIRNQNELDFFMNYSSLEHSFWVSYHAFDT